jgi:transposase
VSYIKKSKRNGKIYLSEVENKKINGKVVTKHIRYIGKEADGETILASSISNAEIEQVKVYGPLLILHHISKEIDLPSQLGEYADEILSMVYAHCMNFESINQMPEWFKRTDLNMILDIDDLTEHRLLMALDALEKKDPIVLQKQIFDNVSTKYNLKHDGIVYDVTNTYFCGNKCELGKFGKDKDGVKGRPLIQIGLGVTQTEGIPVFHKVFHGNIHDSRIFQDMAVTFRDYKIKNGIVVFDRGVSSKTNQESIKALKWKVLCGLPIGTELKEKLRETISQKTFLDLKNRVKLNKVVFYVETISYKISNVRGKLAFCYNDRKNRELTESRYDEITNAAKLLNEGEEIKQGLQDFFGKNNKILMQKVRDAGEFDGYSAIFTTDLSLSKEDMVRMYFDKDLIEKAFQSLKGIIKLRPIRHWLYNRVIAHVFICYLAYLLLSILKMKLEKIEISPMQALKELDTLYRVYFRDKNKNFKIEKIVALNKIQEKIIKAVDKKLITQKGRG